ncbi:unnamed protein product [Notodromas monacha]|uniref:Copper transport protein n=1 Tax=Notodromas monacha TaxID=399045 RepID=A0A7R9BI44_9CRUS|nr:unnamed protein product [Notodromas monacha]CAG0915922.1 unnamed protein product [Notodromas monacha]
MWKVNIIVEISLPALGLFSTSEGSVRPCAYEDFYGVTNYYRCPRQEDDPSKIYCCGNDWHAKCCEKLYGSKSLNEIDAVFGILALVFLALILVVVCCCCCFSCCLLYRMRKKQQLGRCRGLHVDTVVDFPNNVPLPEGTILGAPQGTTATSDHPMTVVKLRDDVFASSMSEDNHAHHHHSSDLNSAIAHVGVMDHSPSRYNQTDTKWSSSSEGHAAMGHGMKMYFHGGYEEIILFNEWRINSVGDLLWSMLVIFLMGMSYEGIKYFRDYLFRKNGAQMANAVREETRKGTVTRGTSAETSSDPDVAFAAVHSKPLVTPLHLIQTVLHIVQFVLSYWLMLIFMTYNVWLCLALTCGAGVGYFVFGSRLTVDVTDHCG